MFNKQKRKTNTDQIIVYVITALILVFGWILVMLAVSALSGCDLIKNVEPPLTESGKVPSVTVPIYPFPDPFKQLARMERRAPVEILSRKMLIQSIKRIPYSVCKSECLLSIECLYCGRVHFFCTEEAIPKKSLMCECEQTWIIRYLNSERIVLSLRRKEEEGK